MYVHNMCTYYVFLTVCTYVKVRRDALLNALNATALYKLYIQIIRLLAFVYFSTPMIYSTCVMYTCVQYSIFSVIF
jgi:hypothetical protein